MTLIKWPLRAGQVKDYTNLVLDGHTPTDIDFVYDLRGRKYVLGELKAVNTPMPEGQRKMLRYLIQNLVRAGCEVCLMVAEHDTNPSQHIDVGNCIITKCTTVRDGVTSESMYIGMRVVDACNEFLGLED